MDSENNVQKNVPNESSENLVRSFIPQGSKFSLTPTVLGILAGALILGSLSGFFIAGNKNGLKTATSTVTTSEDISKGQIFGSDDTKTFKDKAEGIMKEGGIDGEGAYHLVRTGGDSQNVYLTSSIVDLSIFLDRKVRVWGQTQKAQRAGWLMDVGRVEALQ